MSGKFSPGFWYAWSDAPKVELPNWLIATDGKQSVPAFWSPRAVSEYWPQGGHWEFLFEPQDCGGEAMDELIRFMLPPKVTD